MFNSDSVLFPKWWRRGLIRSGARVAVGGFLAGYLAKTLGAYALDLRQWSQWCLNHDIDLFEVRRAHIELFARWLKETGFYRYCNEEQLIDHSPAAHVRRPKVSYESTRWVWTGASSACFW